MNTSIQLCLPILLYQSNRLIQLSLWMAMFPDVPTLYYFMLSNAWWFYLSRVECYHYTAKNAQVATRLLTSCNRLVINKLILGCVHMACNSLLTTSQYQYVFAWLATACWQRTCRSTDLLQVFAKRLDASCCKQVNAWLLILVNYITNFIFCGFC